MSGTNGHHTAVLIWVHPSLRVPLALDWASDVPMGSRYPDAVAAMDAAVALIKSGCFAELQPHVVEIAMKLDQESEDSICERPHSIH